MFLSDFSAANSAAIISHEYCEFTQSRAARSRFFFWKRAFDIVVSILLVPLMIGIATCLILINPFLNAGPLFFVQSRMGKNCAPFAAVKFRTMRRIDKITRGANDPLEVDRISRFGHILRKSRIDELPQILNVLRGDMSLIGPRPDYFEHACEFIASVPGYRERHAIRPGISGLAQTEVGYVEGSDATKKKVLADLFYIQNSSFRLEAWVFWRTLVTIFKRAGS